MLGHWSACISSNNIEGRGITARPCVQRHRHRWRLVGSSVITHDTLHRFQLCPIPCSIVTSINVPCPHPCPCRICAHVHGHYQPMLRRGGGMGGGEVVTRPSQRSPSATERAAARRRHGGGVSTLRHRGVRTQVCQHLPREVLARANTSQRRC